MKEIQNIAQNFWNLFYSRNRYIYIESLMAVYDEYLYNDYFLTKETCIQIIAEYFSGRIIDISADEEEGDTDITEPMAAKIINRLVRFTWLKKVEDYSSFQTNIVIPDYASVFIEVFKKLDNPQDNDTDLYIQNVYTNLYSFYYDRKAGMELLRTAMVNTTRLNRALQDMLHNMDQFFGALLEKERYEELLQEHLEIYVETIVNKKYSLLKTSDNFYKYKNDIKKLLRFLQEDGDRQDRLKHEKEADGEEYTGLVYEIERGIFNMEKRISHIDAEHSKYIRATVKRLEYLIGKEDNVKGNVISLLNLIAREGMEEMFPKVTKLISLHDPTVISPESLYKRRGKRKAFEETAEEEVLEEAELSREDILRLNQSKSRYSQEQIEHYILDKMENGVLESRNIPVASEEEFQLLILSYDYSTRVNSPFWAEIRDERLLTSGKYRYPDLTFGTQKKVDREEE